MKIFIITLCALFICSVSNAQTETMNWYVEGALYDTTTCESGGDIDLPAITPTKRGYTFQGWWTYTPIEYLESTGTQYIDTGIVPSYTRTKIETVLQPLPEQESPVGTLFGCGSLVTGNRFFMQAEDFKFSIGVGRTYYVSPVAINKKMVVFEPDVTGYYRVTIGDQTYSYSINTAGAITNPISILHTKERIYYFKIYDNDVLVRDFVPVLDYNGVPCMFDKVSETFFYNKGTGDFIAGPIVSE